MYKKIRLILICILLATSLNSCVLAAVLIGGAVIAGGAVYYVKGDYIIEVPRDIRSVYNATIKTIQSNNQYSLTGQSYSNTSAVVTATQGDDKVEIELKTVEKRSTEIKIRIGTLGDEKRSTALANEITKNIT